MDKKEARKAVRAILATLPHHERAARSLALCRAVAAHPAVARAHTVALFSSLPDEPDTRSLIDFLLPDKRILLPVVLGDKMDFYPYEKGRLRTGAYGILEPEGSAPVAADAPDVIIVPGVAFTRGGLRLGRGKGFYDKFLSMGGCRAVKIGICFAEQILDSLPCEEHDVRMDFVIYK